MPNTPAARTARKTTRKPAARKTTRKPAARKTTRKPAARKATKNATLVPLATVSYDEPE